jgi:NADH:ubiquinone oxidoreductase subunit C
MYGINYLYKNDTRRLLLDYIKSENPLKKTFQNEGCNDIFYSIFENQTIFSKNEVVEL